MKNHDKEHQHYISRSFPPYSISKRLDHKGETIIIIRWGGKSTIVCSEFFDVFNIPIALHQTLILKDISFKIEFPNTVNYSAKHRTQRNDTFDGELKR